MIFEVAHQMALAPLFVLLVLRGRGQRRDVAYWWLTAAFLISWGADWLQHWINPWFAIQVYLVSQAGLIGFVFLSHQDALGFLGVLGVAGLLTAVGLRAGGPDVLLHTVAWLGVSGIVWDRRGLGALRTSLLLLFGIGWLAWMAYAAVPGWPTWLAYQAVRASGLAVFCWALWCPGPALTLRLSRRRVP